MNGYANPLTIRLEFESGYENIFGRERPTPNVVLPNTCREFEYSRTQMRVPDTGRETKKELVFMLD